MLKFASLLNDLGAKKTTQKIHLSNQEADQRLSYLLLPIFSKSKKENKILRHSGKIKKKTIILLYTNLMFILANKHLLNTT